MASIVYRFGNDLNLDQIVELYHASNLAERRPVDDRQIMSDMIRHANLVVTAWEEELLIGIARTAHCFRCVAILADLAVAASHQRQASHRMIPARVRWTALDLVLLAAPNAAITIQISFTSLKVPILRAADAVPPNIPGNLPDGVSS